MRLLGTRGSADAFHAVVQATPALDHDASRGGNLRSKPMKVSEAMTRHVRVASPDETVRDVARLMADVDAGVVPVGENDRLVGMVTDRDIAIRAVAEGRGPDTPVRDVMTPDVRYCFEDEDTAEVARTMAREQVRRLPVLDSDKRLVGIISLGDIALTESPDAAAAAIEGVSEPGGARSRTGGPRT
jgi:CBS domain-containing protein